MGNLEIRNKKQIFLDDTPLVPDLFDETIEYWGNIVAFNKEKVIFFTLDGKTIKTVEGNIYQINEAGKCFSFKNTDGKMGVYNFKGELLVPFDFDLIFIKYQNEIRFEVKKDFFQGDWEVYNVKK